jgi:hypothetical protein
VEVLRKVKEKGYRTGLISNGHDPRLHLQGVHGADRNPGLLRRAHLLR